MTASSSQLSQSRRTTSTASAASSNSSPPSGAGCRPNSAASCAVPLSRTRQPARPCEIWSSVAIAFETWNGSVWVTVATGIRPMWWVTGAMRAARSVASARPASRRGEMSGRRPGCASRLSSMLRKSSRPLGGARQRGPVSTTEWPTAGRVVRERISPRLRMPTVAVQRHGQVQLGHDRPAESSRIVLITHCATLRATMHSGAGLSSV